MRDDSEKRRFAHDGYVVMPQVVTGDLIEAAHREVQRVIREEPPAAEHRGPHSYFLAEPLPPSLTALLFSSQAISVAEALVDPRRFEAPDHVKIGNTSATTREMVYFRLRCAGHRDQWRECVRDPLLEFEPVRNAVAEADGQ